MTLLRSSVFVLPMAVALAGCPGENRPKNDGGIVSTDAGCSIDDPYTTPTAATAPERENGTAPQLACVTTAEVWAESTTVAMGGCLDVFGVGERIVATTLKVAVFDMDQNPATESPAYGEAAVETTTLEAINCPKGAYYRVEGVPTSTPLLVKVYDSQRSASMVVVDSYQYNVMLDPAKIEILGGEYVFFEANVIYSATYQSLPTLASRPVQGMDDISDGVGRGVIAGEVQDCDEKVLENVVVSSPCMDSQTRLIYTIGTDCDQPDRSRTASGPCGTYAYLNVEPGQQLVEAWYKDGSTTRKLGSAKIYVFPDAVTIYTPHGLPPVTGAVDAGLPDSATSTDATVSPDAMTTPDATTATDATTADTMTTEDATTAADAMTTSDATTTSDAGVEDASTEDASAEDA
ncbi:MAG: hypothetical protein ABIJ09_16615 [Pseudomonadota bacterium]